MRTVEDTDQETIDERGLAGLPARAIEAMVESLRRKTNGRKSTTPPPPLPLKRGTVIGPLTRDRMFG